MSNQLGPKKVNLSTYLQTSGRITSSTRLATPPQSPSSLLRIVNGEVQPNASYLFSPNCNMSAIEHHIEQSYNKVAPPSTNNNNDKPNPQQQPQIPTILTNANNSPSLPPKQDGPPPFLRLGELPRIFKPEGEQQQVSVPSSNNHDDSNNNIQSISRSRSRSTSNYPPHRPSSPSLCDNLPFSNPQQQQQQLSSNSTTATPTSYLDPGKYLVGDVPNQQGQSRPSSRRNSNTGIVNLDPDNNNNNNNNRLPNSSSKDDNNYSIYPNLSPTSPLQAQPTLIPQTSTSNHQRISRPQSPDFCPGQQNINVHQHDALPGGIISLETLQQAHAYQMEKERCQKEQQDAARLANNNNNNTTSHNNNTGSSDPYNDDNTPRYDAQSIARIVKAQALMRGWLQRVRARKNLLKMVWLEIDTKEEQELSLNNSQYKNLRTMVDNDHAEANDAAHRVRSGSVNGSVMGGSVIGADITKHQQQHLDTIPPNITSPKQNRFNEDNDEIAAATMLRSKNRTATTGDNNNNSMDNQLEPSVRVDDDVDDRDHNRQQQQQHVRPAMSTTSSHIALSTASSRGRVENGLYLPATALSFVEPTTAEDGGLVSLSDLNIPSSAPVVSPYGESDLSDWQIQVQQRMRHLQLLREFRQHATPTAPSSDNLNGDGIEQYYPDGDQEEMMDEEEKQQEQQQQQQQPPQQKQQPQPLKSSDKVLDIDWGALDTMLQDKQEREYFFNKSPAFRSRLNRHFSVSRSITNIHPRASLRPITSKNPIDLDWVMQLRDECAQGKIPNAAIIERLILLAFSILCQEPNVVDVRVPNRGKLTVVGDLHGQYQDLLCIFKINGPPSASNYYIFNGDWVDRGSNSIEVLSLILSWKVLYPKYVFLNRGNHESEDINGRDGFSQECARKFGVGIFPLFSELFSAIPIASRVHGTQPLTQQQQQKKPPRRRPTIFVTHGGIPKMDLTIEEIQQQNRFHKILPPESLLFNMLWSDPSPYKGLHPSPRGAGVLFGPDVSLNFAKTNGCAMLIRSHECVEGGWNLSHSNLCLTVFSASNYCGVVGNQGSICIIESTLRPTLVTYYAQETSTIRSSIHFRKLESAVVRKLMDRIAIHRLDLISAFRKMAQSNAERIKNGETSIQVFGVDATIPCSDEVITREQWAQGLRDVLGLNIPFLLFQEQLGLSERGVLGAMQGPISFMAFLSNFTPKHDLFNMMGNNSNQQAQNTSTTNIFNSTSIMSQPTVPLTPAAARARNAPNGAISSKVVNVHYSATIFPVEIFYNANNQPIITHDLARLTLLQLGQLFFSHKYELEAVFRFLDFDNSSFVTKSELITGLFSLIKLFCAKVAKMRDEQHPDVHIYSSQSSLLLEIPWTRENLTILAEIVDENNDDEIQYQEFLQHFTFDATSLVNNIETAETINYKLFNTPTSSSNTQQSGTDNI